MKVILYGSTGGIGSCILKQLPETWEVYLASKAQRTHDGPLNEFYDIFIDAAGVIEAPVATSHTIDQHVEMDINFFIPTKRALECLAINPNCIIAFLGSSAQKQGKAQWTYYCASKAALRSWTESMVAENYKIYNLAPGRTNTKMRQKCMQMAKEDPKTLLEPEEVAQCLLSLINTQKPGCYYINKDTFQKDDK